MHYRKGGSANWMKMEDSSYPFEFTIPLQSGEEELELWIEGTTPNGELLKGDKVTLKK